MSYPQRLCHSFIGGALPPSLSQYCGNCRIPGTFRLHPLLRAMPISHALLGTSSKRQTEQVACARHSFVSSLAAPEVGAGPVLSFQMRKLRLGGV